MKLSKNSKLCKTLDYCISHPYITRQLISQCSINKGNYLKFKCLNFLCLFSLNIYYL